MPRLEGECNRCGACCVVDGFQCQYLLREKPVGQPEASVCTAYAQRYQGMPITLRKGIQFMLGHCAKDTDEETEFIIKHGIGHGCSLIQIESNP